MSIAVFEWAPDIGARKKRSATVKASKFGDGYEQRAPDGINHIFEVWTVSFTGNEGQVGPIEDFFDSVLGTTSFQWTSPQSKTMRVVCEEYTVDRSVPGVLKIDAEFRQVFDLN